MPFLYFIYILPVKGKMEIEYSSTGYDQTKEERKKKTGILQTLASIESLQSVHTRVSSQHPMREN